MKRIPYWYRWWKPITQARTLWVPWLISGVKPSGSKYHAQRERKRWRSFLRKLTKKKPKRSRRAEMLSSELPVHYGMFTSDVGFTQPTGIAYLSKCRKGWGRESVGGRRMGFDPKRKPMLIMREWWNGRHDTLRGYCSLERAGSSPALRTN